MADNGVTLALDAARAKYPDENPYTTVQQALTAPKDADPITVNAIYNFEKKGYFPPDRARVLADTFELKYEDLISPRLRKILRG